MNFILMLLLVLLGVCSAVPHKESCRNVVYHVQTLQQVGLRGDYYNKFMY